MSKHGEWVGVCAVCARNEGGRTPLKSEFYLLNVAASAPHLHTSMITTIDDNSKISLMPGLLNCPRFPFLQSCLSHIIMHMRESELSRNENLSTLLYFLNLFKLEFLRYSLVSP